MRTKHVESHDEQWLLEQALRLIRHHKIRLDTTTGGWVGDFNSANACVLCAAVKANYNKCTLADILCLGLDEYNQTTYRQTGFNKLGTAKNPGKVFRINPTHDGGEVLAQLATGVLLAAMYDILAADYIVNEVGLKEWCGRDKMYVPRPNMVGFVRKNRTANKRDILREETT